MKQKKEKTAGAASCPTSTPTATPSASETVVGEASKLCSHGNVRALQSSETSPTMKVPRKVRGTLTIKTLDDMEFRADRLTGLSSQEEIARTAEGRLYRTVGEKKRSTVAHITIPDGTADTRSFLYEAVEKLTEGIGTKAKPKMRGVRLMDDDDLTVTFSKKERTIEATLRIELEKTPAYTSRLITLMQRLNQCLSTNQTTFLKPKR